MYSTEDKVHAEICDENAEKCNDAVEMEEPCIAEARQKLAVQRSSIDKHRYQCPYLLWIPAPIVTPADICPDSTDEDANGKQCHSRIQHDKREMLQFLPPDFGKHSHHTVEKNQEQQCVCYHNNCDMERQKRG